MECPICGNTSLYLIFSYTTPPLIETRYPGFDTIKYYRETRQCNHCLHFIAVQEIDLSLIYCGDYVTATYKDKAGVERTFERIISLPKEKSDNNGRVERINEFCIRYWGTLHNKSALDIGSGLGVFPYLMNKTGWSITALDPDQRAAEHISENAGVHTICGDFFKVDIQQKFDLITFNKVLEHVKDPVRMLAKSRDNLTEIGLVYVEVPDGDIAMIDGSEREEFTIDHLHIFSFISLAMTADKAGFYPVIIERLKEPSTKYTLRAFLRRK